MRMILQVKLHIFVSYVLDGVDNQCTVQYEEGEKLKVKLSIFLIYVIDGDGQSSVRFGSVIRGERVRSTKAVMKLKNECGIGNENLSRVYHCIAFPSLSLAPN